MSHSDSVGHLIRHTREMLDLTQKELASEIGCSAITIRKIEAGERRPSKHLARKLAESLKISASKVPHFMEIVRAMDLPDTSELLYSNLPLPLSSLVGRKAEIEATRQKLLQPSVRLLTLIGPPGVGKTRLALETAQTLIAEFNNNIFLVELDYISEPEQLLPFIKSSLNVEDSPESLARCLIRPTLLVLNNFESIVRGAAVVAKLLHSYPSLKILVTSREALQLNGEHLNFVSPLALPDLSRFHELTLEEILKTESLSLFLQRIQAIRPDFNPGWQNIYALARICNLLDGLPLAIELAAARTNFFEPGYMLDYLANPLDFLVSYSRDLPPRHQSLRVAFDSSYQALTKPLQNLLYQLASFEGSFTLKQIQEVYPAQFGLNLLDGLEQLVNRQLLRQHPAEAGALRFSLFNTIRAYLNQNSEIVIISNELKAIGVGLS